LTLFGLERQQAALAPRLQAVFARVLASGDFILGAEVEAFEHEVAGLLDVKHAVGLSSGTDALVCGLQLLGCGAGREVVLPAFSFFATAEAVCRAGARPRLVDITLDCFGMDLQAVSGVLGPSTGAVLPVHLYGAPADLQALLVLTREAGVPVIEDAAQAFGASFAGKSVGGWGTVGCFSFFPTKPLGGLGDGGMLVTDDAALAARCRRLRVHGASGKHCHQELAGNYRLDALQAALLRTKLEYVDGWRRARAEHVQVYRERLSTIGEVALPTLPQGAESAHALYTIRVLDGQRDALAEHLKRSGIPTAVYYPRPLHAQPALEFLGYRQGQFPAAEQASRQVLSLPLFAEMTRAEVALVSDAVCAFFA
jgi:dTDP-4-amino-4,6-dideoxygalactose transaminase